MSGTDILVLVGRPMENYSVWGGSTRIESSLGYQLTSLHVTAKSRFLFPQAVELTAVWRGK
jgi:hypothetical protein